MIFGHGYGHDSHSGGQEKTEVVGVGKTEVVGVGKGKARERASETYTS